MVNKRKHEFAIELRKEMQTTVLTKVSISDICKRLRCSRQSFYYYFDEIEDCFSYFLKDSFRTEISDKYLISDVFNYFDRNAAFIEIINAEQVSRTIFWDTLYGYARKALDGTLSRNIQEYLTLYSEQREAIVSFYAAGILEEAKMYLVTNHVPPKEKRIAYCKAMLGTSEDMRDCILRFSR